MMWAGVLKSGSPRLKSMIGLPSAFNCRALAPAANVAEGCTAAAILEIGSMEVSRVSGAWSETTPPALRGSFGGLLYARSEQEKVGGQPLAGRAAGGILFQEEDSPNRPLSCEGS